MPVPSGKQGVGKGNPPEAGRAAATPGCSRTPGTPPAGAREEPSALTWGCRAAGTRPRSSGSRPLRARRPRRPPGSRPAAARLPPRRRSALHHAGNAAAAPGADITLSQVPPPAPRSLAAHPPGEPAKQRPRGQAGRAQAPLIGRGDSHSGEQRVSHSRRGARLGLEGAVGGESCLACHLQGKQIMVWGRALRIASPASLGVVTTSPGRNETSPPPQSPL